MAEHKLHDWLTLRFIPGIGGRTICRLLVEFETPADILRAPPEQLKNIEGLGTKLAGTLSDQAVVRKAEEQASLEIQNISRSGVTVIHFADPGYPAGLKNIHDPPVLLYCRGNVDLLGRQAVALVGSRSATTYGRRISFTLARDLARRDICVVSGMALGIDGEAHAGALAGDGATIGVLGCGVDVVYPVQHRALFREVEQHGLLLSEYPLGSAPDAFRFPERNRIISGLSQGVVVVEAATKSGSLITARLALEQGREVFAVPGRVDSVKSQGAHRLLQQGAKLVHTVDDILEELQFTSLRCPEYLSGSESGQPETMSENEHHLLGCLDTYPMNIDELAHLSGYDPALLADLLIRLELKGVVRQLPGQHYERCIEI